MAFSERIDVLAVLEREESHDLLDIVGLRGLTEHRSRDRLALRELLLRKERLRHAIQELRGELATRDECLADDGADPAVLPVGPLDEQVCR